MEREKYPKTLGEAIVTGAEKGKEFSDSVKERKHKVAERLKYLRYSRKKTQSDIQDGTKINRITYSAYETERAEPNTEVLCRLAKFYGVSIDYLACMTDNPKGLYASQNNAENAVKDPTEALQAKLEELNNRLEAIEKKNG